jgi:hypothetical protein
LGHIVKMGHLSSEMIVKAIFNPKPVTWWNSAWSFFDAQLFTKNEVNFILAKLSKFNPEGTVIISDPRTKQEVVQAEPNLRIASSVFIYIPEVSGIAFTKAYNHIDQFHFIHEFASIIKNTYDDFFVECDIHLITDLHTFAEKLMSLKGIYKISAKVNPPNPLFSPLWEPLKDYIKSRNSAKMIIREDAGADKPLNTNLPEHVMAVANQTSEVPYEPKTPLAIGDAAILMAADGYGTGTVRGIRENDMVVIKTSDTVRNFDFDRVPDPQELFDVAYDIFKRIEKDRHMEH